MAKEIKLPETRKEFIKDRVHNLWLDLGWGVFVIAMAMVVSYFAKVMMIP